MAAIELYTTDFHPDHTFDCGQCFRWNREEDGSYSGIASGHMANVAYSSGVIRLKNADPDDMEFWHRYFDLNTDYGTIKKKLAAADPILAEAIEFGGGMRILRQDPWETLISFILSANNNIPRIKKCIESLAFHFGEEAGTFREKTYHNLPTPFVLSALSPEDLAVCRLGYRAKYLVETAKEIREKGIENLETCMEGLSGVGPKVANCISLFSLAKYHCFPIDVWMKKVMSQLYGFDEKDTKGMVAFANQTFGPYAGLAQQYLFYYMRSKRS